MSIFQQCDPFPIRCFVALCLNTRIRPLLFCSSSGILMMCFGILHFRPLPSQPRRFRLPGTIPTRHGTGTGYGYRTGYTKAYSISAARYQGEVASDLFAAKFGENGVCAFRTYYRTTYFILLSPSAHPSNN